MKNHFMVSGAIDFLFLQLPKEEAQHATVHRRFDQSICIPRVVSTVLPKMNIVIYQMCIVRVGFH